MKEQPPHVLWRVVVKQPPGKKFRRVTKFFDSDELANKFGSDTESFGGEVLSISRYELQDVCQKGNLPL